MSFDRQWLAGESQTLEYKASFDRTAVESLVAFANAEGGTVLVGMKNDGTPQGVTLGQETLNEWLGQIKSTTSPSLIPDLYPETLDGRTLVAIHIDEFPVKPVSTRGRYLKRAASSNHQLNTAEIANLYMQSLQLSWDAYEAPGSQTNNLSVEKITRFIEKVNESGRFTLENETSSALEKLQYLRGGKPTWAALLLFSKEPLRHHVHIGRFKTASTIIDDRYITDTLFEAVEQAMKCIVSHISVAFEFDGNLRRKERFAYPLPALRETLLNAVVHRDYNDPSDIQIKIFDDRITFYSPGGFYGGLKAADLRSDHYPSRLRNKLIAEAFYLTNNIEKYGSGFIRIRKALRDYPEVRLEIEELGDGVLLAFIQAESARTTDDIGSEKSSEKILELLQAQPKLSAKEVALHLAITPRAVEKQIDRLKREGRLFRIGPARGGRWKVGEIS
jgi:ATP-dependent DNA helicase RecG